MAIEEIEFEDKEAEAKEKSTEPEVPDTLINGRDPNSSTTEILEPIESLAPVVEVRPVKMTWTLANERALEADER